MSTQSIPVRTQCTPDDYSEYPREDSVYPCVSLRCSPQSTPDECSPLGPRGARHQRARVSTRSNRVSTQSTPCEYSEYPCEYSEYPCVFARHSMPAEYSEGPA
jgi:hypothetical protein